MMTCITNFQKCISSFCSVLYNLSWLNVRKRSVLLANGQLDVINRCQQYLANRQLDVIDRYKKETYLNSICQMDDQISVINAITINGVGWYNVNMRKVKIYFTCTCNNYAKLYKSADSHVKNYVQLSTNRFAGIQLIGLPDFQLRTHCFFLYINLYFTKVLFKAIIIFYLI